MLCPDWLISDYSSSLEMKHWRASSRETVRPDLSSNSKVHWDIHISGERPEGSLKAFHLHPDNAMGLDSISCPDLTLSYASAFMKGHGDRDFPFLPVLKG